jgi:hypothetical protein
LKDLHGSFGHVENFRVGVAVQGDDSSWGYSATHYAQTSAVLIRRRYKLQQSSDHRKRGFVGGSDNWVEKPSFVGMHQASTQLDFTKIIDASP